MKLFEIPIIEDESAPTGTPFLMPQVHPVVHEPPGGFKTVMGRISAEQAALVDAYVQAAKRGEVGVIKNVKA